jgi:hypothetical protein
VKYEAEADEVVCDELEGVLAVDEWCVVHVGTEKCVLCMCSRDVL